MQHDIQVLDRVKSAYATLRPSEQRVADCILQDPEGATKCTISELAERVQVSQPTVVRFVQALGFDGYRSFKYCLLRDRSGKTPQTPYFDHLGDFDLKPWDRLEELPLKETRMAGGLLEDALKSLSTQALSRAVRMLATARTIDIYGVENSMTPASDLLTGATLIVKRIRGIRRAAMAPVIPTTTGQAVLIDCGANAECTPEYLVQFAYLGSYYAHRVLGVERPRVGLLNIGAEDSKGTDLQKETLRWLREAHTAGHLNFIGNIEAKEAIKGGCDVIVCDGFSGNVLLKTMEGVGSFAGSALKAMFKKNLLTKLAALCVMPGLNAFKAKLDPNKVGGTAFIGISRPVIKAHGSSNAEAIENAMGQAVQVARSGIIRDIEENVALMKVERE